MADFVQVCIARDTPHAYLLKGALEEAGIEVVIENESLQGALGELPAFSTAPRLIVRESDAARALEILKGIDGAAQED